MLNDDSYCTGTAETPVCDCGKDNETVSHLLLHCSKYTDAIQRIHDTIDDIYIYIYIYILLQTLDILHWIKLTLLLLHCVTTTVKIKTIYLLKKLCSSSSTALTGDYESHHELFIILFDCLQLKKIHVTLSCFYSVSSFHLDERSTILCESRQY